MTDSLCANYEPDQPSELGSEQIQADCSKGRWRSMSKVKDVTVVKTQLCRASVPYYVLNRSDKLLTFAQTTTSYLSKLLTRVRTTWRPLRPVIRRVYNRFSYIHHHHSLRCTSSSPSS